jgi:hypothetical protein
MSRLIDKIMANKTRLGKITTGDPSVVFSLTNIENAELIVIDNVAHYFDSQKNDAHLSTSGFPNMAPPFSNFYMEFRMPRSMRRWGDEVATHFISFSLKGDSFQGSDIDKIKSEYPEAHWLLTCVMWCWSPSGDKQLYSFPFLVSFMVREDGSYLPGTGGDFLIMGIDPASLPDEDIQLFIDTVTWIVNPCLLAISFLHCKNVTMRAESPPLALSKNYQKKFGRPLVSYHTLNIEPMKKVLRTEGNSEKTGLKQALHICRGHFKDFSKGKGLFGKYKGLYFWESQVRGSVSEGIVDKDYAVKSPTN